MEETAAVKKSNGNYYVRIIGTLFIITAVVSIILGLVNMVTKPTIDRLAAEKKAASMQEVMAECEFGSENLYTGDDSSILELVSATQGGALKGYCVQVETNGFGGALQLMVGVDVSGAVTGVVILKHSETLNTDKHGTLITQYPGHAGSVAISKDGGDINAISGATVTSRAVTRGVNAALSAVAALGN